jgi:GNAT superfamily N-acetyltransferase
VPEPAGVSGGERLPARVWYLEMRSPDELRPARDPGGHVRVERAAVPLPELNRFFYAEVGRAHHWVDRAGWSLERWRAYVERPELETWLVHERGTPAGYAELEARAESVEVAFFGILPAFHGRGLGGHLLTAVVRRGWETGAAKVTVNTCELDGPYAMRHYETRGFRVVRAEVELRGRARP